jgi:uncharacterized membrane protein YfcA
MRREEHVSPTGTPFAERLKLNGIYQMKDGSIQYGVSHPAGGFSLMYIAGLLSGLLGIGSGALKVIAMDSIMGIPFRVSTATSTFMIGVTGVASAAIYLKRGYIHPVIAMPVMFGVLCGSMVGARLLTRLPVRHLRRLFAVIVAVVAVQMIVEGIRGKL